MKQYAIVYKQNKIPLAFYCTVEAAMGRMMFITDTNVLGVFEVDVTIHSVLETDMGDVDHHLGVVCSLNKSLLSIHFDTSTAYQYRNAISSGLFEICDVSYELGKEIKRPKKEEEDNGFGDPT